MDQRQKAKRGLALGLGVVLFALALLLREAFLAVVTAPITSFLASIQVGLTGEWIFRFIMAIVAVALILVAIGLDNVEKAAKTLYGWYRSVRYPRKAQELEAQERWHRQDALKEWRDTLAKWVVDRDNPLTEAEFFDPRRKAARRQTLEVLKHQDPEGKKSVLLILYDWSLIRRYPFPIIDLSHADFSNAHLESVDLQGTNLSRVNLKDADLSGARLGQSPENISKMEQAARAIRMIAGDLTNSAYTCDLQGAKLSGAILKNAVLVGCVLVDADFEESDLDGADLRGANLRAALNLTQEQVNKAYGSYQQEGMPDTQLPDDHLEAPKAWKKPLSQQMAEREASSS